MIDSVIQALSSGITLAISFNPLFALVGATAAAALAGRRKASHEQRFWAGSLLVGAWLVGDGLRILARARDAHDGVGRMLPESPMWADWTLLATWALIGLTVGYGIPAWAGAFAGRRVTHGTGWLAAGSVAAGTVLAVSSLVAYAA